MQKIARKAMINIAILLGKPKQGELEMDWTVIWEIMECCYINH